MHLNCRKDDGKYNQNIQHREAAEVTGVFHTGGRKTRCPNFVRWQGGPKQRLTVQGTIRRKYVLAALWTVKLGLTKVGNQAKPLKCPGKKVVLHTNLEKTFKRTATNLDRHPTTMQLRLTCVLKNSRLLPHGCCCFNDTGNKILFGINWQHVNQGCNVGL